MTVASAIALYDAAQSAASPDWRAVAEALRAAIERRKPRRATSRDDGYTDVCDYVASRKSTRVGPTMVVTFDDDTMVRATFSTQEGKPINSGLGLRVAVAFYRTKRMWPLAKMLASRFGGLDAVAQVRREMALINALAVPAIRSAHVERDGEVLATYAPDECSAATATLRAGKPMERLLGNLDPRTIERWERRNDSRKFRTIETALAGYVALIDAEAA